MKKNKRKSYQKTEKFKDNEFDHLSQKKIEKINQLTKLNQRVNSFN